MSSSGRNVARLLRSLARIVANDPTRVGFTGWRIGDEGARRLLLVVARGNTVVAHLRLSYNHISASLVSALMGLLENSTTLRELDLNGNRIGDEGARAVARFLHNNSSLVRLNLNNCGVGVEGVRVLAGGLLSNSTLTTLYLDENNIGDVGARLLAKALLVNFSIITVWLMENDISEELGRLIYELERINARASSQQEALELKVAWLRNLDEGGLSLLGFGERGVEEEVRRLEVVCRVGWLISSGLNGDKEDADTLVLDQLDHFMRADQRRGLYERLLGVPELGVDLASSVDETTARTLYRYAVQCGAAPCVLMNLLRAHGSLCTCRDIEHHLIPFMLLATMTEAGVGDVMELLLINPSLVESGISGPKKY